MSLRKITFFSFAMQITLQVLVSFLPPTVMFDVRNQPRPYRMKLVSEERIDAAMQTCQIDRYVLQISWLISLFDVSSATAPDVRAAQPVCLQRGGWIASLHHPQPPVTANATI